MPITINYTETRTSTITLDRGEARMMLCRAGSATTIETSNAEIAAALQAELSTVTSNLPAELEPLVDPVAEISHREWTATAS